MTPPANCSPRRTISFGSSWLLPGVSTSSAFGTCWKRSGRSAWSGCWRRLSLRLAARLEEEHQEALEARVQQANRSAQAARRELIQKLNQITRRLRGFEDQRQWSNTLVDATRGFCGRAALFLIRDGRLHLETTRNFDDADLADAVPLHEAPAFVAAVETRDTLVAMRSSGELSDAIAAVLG